MVDDGATPPVAMFSVALVRTAGTEVEYIATCDRCGQQIPATAPMYIVTLEDADFIPPMQLMQTINAIQERINMRKPFVIGHSVKVHHVEHGLGDLLLEHADVCVKVESSRAEEVRDGEDAADEAGAEEDA